jgi:hypothetical protein
LLPLWTDHRPAQLVQHCPGRMVASQTQHPLESQGTDTALLIRHPPDRSEPEAQRKLAVFENGPSGEGNVPVAVPALPQIPAGSPSLGMMAPGALKALRPAQPEQIAPTGFFGAEPMLEFEESPWIAFRHKRIL